MSLTLWEPLRRSDEFDRIVDNFLGNGRMKQVERTWKPAADLIAEKDAYVFRFDLPGVAKEQIDIDVVDDGDDSRGAVSDDVVGGLQDVDARRRTGAAAAHATDEDDELGLALDEAMAGLAHVRSARRRSGAAVLQAPNEDDELGLSLIAAMEGLDALVQARRRRGAAKASLPDEDEEAVIGTSLGTAMHGLEHVRKRRV